MALALCAALPIDVPQLLRGIWAAGFVDYAYLALTNSMAFSPTDVMPLTTRAKALMGLQSFIAFSMLVIVIVIVIVRAVSLLA